MKPQIFELLHRYVFDHIYNQKHKINILDRIILYVYNKYERANWRYEIRKYAKSLIRYSDFDRDEFYLK